MTDLSDTKIKQLIESYNIKRIKDKERYERLKNTEEFKQKNRARASSYYNNNKEARKNKYQENKDFYSARSSYNYYKKKNKEALFIERYPDKVELLKSRNIII